MSAITAPAHILLTGGSGFVGAAVLADLLAQGFSVRATVRSTAKAAPLEKTFKSFVNSNKLTFAIVPDMTIEGAFTEALQGIDGVIHAASPLPPSDPNADPKEIIDPAVKGTTGILKDAAKVPSVKRVVVTSSIVTLLEPKEGKYIYSETDWFDTAPRLVAQYGANAPGGLKYIASKVLAERAAWEWVETNKPSFEFVTVLPPWVWGRSITSNPEHIRPEASNYRLLSALAQGKAGTLKAEDYYDVTEFTDVLDIAAGHLKALTVPEAAGQRFNLCGGLVVWQDVYDLLNANPIASITVPQGNVGSGKTFSPERHSTGEKAVKVLGMTYRPIETTIREAITQAMELGWSIDKDVESQPGWK